jgi:hypothetical protein
MEGADYIAEVFFNSLIIFLFCVCFDNWAWILTWVTFVSVERMHMEHGVSEMF